MFVRTLSCVALILFFNVCNYSAYSVTFKFYLQKCCHYANFLFFLRSRSVSNDSPDSLFLQGVSMSPAWLKSLSTGADDGTVVLYMINTQATTGYFLSCSSSRDGSFKSGELQPCIQSQQPQRLESCILHTEAAEVFAGISFVIGLWSATTFPRSSDFSKKQVLTPPSSMM